MNYLPKIRTLMLLWIMAVSGAAPAMAVQLSPVFTATPNTISMNGVAYGTYAATPLYIATGNDYATGTPVPAAYKSADGVTWTDITALLPAITAGSGITDPIIGNNSIVINGDFGEVMASTDGGATWSNVTANIVQNPATEGLMGVVWDTRSAKFMALEGTLSTGVLTGYQYRTSTDGITWSAPVAVSGLPTTGMIDRAIQDDVTLVITMHTGTPSADNWAFVAVSNVYANSAASPGAFTAATTAPTGLIYASGGTPVTAQARGGATPLMVMVGKDATGAGAVSISSDHGANWSVPSATGTGALGAVVWDSLHNLFVAEDVNGNLYSSADGLAWSAMGQNIAQPGWVPYIGSGAADGTNFFLTGDNLIAKVTRATTTETTTTTVTVPTLASVTPTTTDLNGIAYGSYAPPAGAAAPLYIATGNDYATATPVPAAYKSADGVTWTAITTLPAIAASGTINSPIIGNNSIVINGSIGNYVATSTDGGATWSNVSTSVAPTANEVVAGVVWNSANSQFLAMEGVLTAGVLSGYQYRTSTDGVTWSAATAVTGLPITGSIDQDAQDDVNMALAWSNGTPSADNWGFVAVGNIYTSSNTTMGTFTAATTIPTGLLYPSYATPMTVKARGGSSPLMVMVGKDATGNGAVSVSADHGVNWSAPSATGTPALGSVDWDSQHNIFIAEDINGALYSSTDGLTWSATGVSFAQTGWVPSMRVGVSDGMNYLTPYASNVGKVDVAITTVMPPSQPLPITGTDTNGMPSISLVDATGAVTSTINYFNNTTTLVAGLPIDIDGDGVNEYAIVGQRSDNLIMCQVRRADGTLVKAFYVNNATKVSVLNVYAAQMDAVAGQELVVGTIRLSDNRPVATVYNPTSGAVNMQTYMLNGNFTSGKFFPMDVNGDGIEEIALGGVKANAGAPTGIVAGRPMVEIRQANGTLSGYVFVLTKNYTNIQFARIDSNGDGIDEVAVMATNANNRLTTAVYDTAGTNLSVNLVLDSTVNTVKLMAGEMDGVAGEEIVLGDQLISNGSALFDIRDSVSGARKFRTFMPTTLTVNQYGLVDANNDGVLDSMVHGVDGTGISTYVAKDKANTAILNGTPTGLTLTGDSMAIGK